MVFGLENYIGNQYLRAFVVLLLVFAVLRLFMLFFEKIIVNFTSKTKTNLDDKFVSSISRPVTALVFLIGIRFSIEELTLAENVMNNISNGIWSLIIISLGFVVYYFVDIVLFVALKKYLKKEASAVRESLTSLLQGIIKAVIISLVLLYVLDVWGIEIGPFLAGLGIAGIAIALALQPALANIFSGVSVILDKSVKVGDLIQLKDETMGKVYQVGLRSTKILTFDNELMIIPNSRVADATIHNIGMPEPKSRVVIPFGVEYGSDIEKVKKLVLSEIKKVSDFVNNPEPLVRFIEMGDSALKFKAFFYVNNYENRWAAMDEANTKIYNALNKAGIGIPFPQMDVHVKK